MLRKLLLLVVLRRIRYVSACVMVSFASLASAAGNLEDNNLRNDLVYYPASGQVQLQVPDFTGTCPIVQFSLGTNDAFNLDDGYVIQGLDCGMIIPPVACGDEQSISYCDPRDVGFEGVFELGRILPAGLTGPGVQDFLTEAMYRTANIPEFVEFDIHVVPEPSGIILLLGIVCFILIKRNPHLFSPIRT